MLCNLRRRISLGEAAAVAGYESTYFSRKFRSVTGRSFLRWRVQQHMRRAKQLLETEHADLGRVASAVGYSSRAAFSRAFRREVGMPPSEYRNLVSNKILPQKHKNGYEKVKSDHSKAVFQGP